MTTIRVVLGAIALSIVWAAPVSVANAQAVRTWVSGVGDDVNPCSRTAPCKTFAGAISKTAAGGEISVLDPGAFGALTITKAITLNGDGTLASILASGTNGIIVNAGAGDVVIIRSLSINGALGGLNGIRFLAGAHLRIENTTIYGFQRGVDVVHSGGGAGQLSMNDVSVTNVSNVAVRVQASGAPATSLNNVRIARALIGFDVLNGTATIANSIISHVTNQGIVAEGTAVINAERCTVHNNGTGVSAFTAGATVRMSRCAIFNNGTGVSIAAGGTGDVFQNNSIFGNTTNVVGTLTSRAQQ